MESVTSQEYVDGLHRRGARAYLRHGRGFWLVSERLGLERYPQTCFDVPPSDYLRSLFWRSRCLVASYVLPPDEAHAANSLLYVCRDRGYCLERLSSPARRDARRALRAFRYEFLEPHVLLAHGANAYCDTRARVGLSDHTEQHFRNRTSSLIGVPGHVFVGAWCGDELAAHMYLQMVDDWVEIAAYAANEHLRSCPNNGLVHFALDYCLAQGRCREVIYGLSSIQQMGSGTSLDYFKKKVGFEAQPVHRAFAFHPLVRPLINPLTDWTIRGCLKFFPKSRILRKASGVVANCLGKPATPNSQAVVIHSDEERPDQCHVSEE